MLTPIPLSPEHLGGNKPRIGDNCVIRRAPKFYPTSLVMWRRSSDVTLRIVSVEPLLAQPVKLARVWHNIVTGESMRHERALA